MSELKKLIIRLKKGISRSASYIKSIKYPQLLVNSLQELDGLIGNSKVKDSVATQVSHLIMMKRRAMANSKFKEDDVMLNTILYGSAGIGKTQISTKLAMIWYSLGFLSGSKISQENKQELGDIIKDLFKDTGSTADENALFLYVMFIFIMIFVTMLSIAWSFYNKFGGIYTLVAVGLILIVIMMVGYYLSSIFNKNNKNTIDIKDIKNSNRDIPPEVPIINQEQGIRNMSELSEGDPNMSMPDMNHQMPSSDSIITVKSRPDFVDKYVGWTALKTNKLLEENVGKVIFVDEAYSLINGPQDEFGMEALTALNLFMSSPKGRQTIVIFAGYKDLMEPLFDCQPGLKRRFMWQFECTAYNPEELFQIFKKQLVEKGWGLTDEKATIKIFKDNPDAFPSFGGDTERLTFFGKLEHSRDFINNEKGMELNMLEPKHIIRGLVKLRENNFKESSEESNNPMANMMKLLSGKKRSERSDASKPTSKPVQQPVKPTQHNLPTYSDASEATSLELLENELINNLRNRALETAHR
jgi:hypothetical protein